jgi:hypothetical protein
MDWVLDSSVAFALALALPDETSEQADHFFSRVTGGSIFWVRHYGGMKWPMP